MELANNSKVLLLASDAQLAWVPLLKKKLLSVTSILLLEMMLLLNIIYSNHKSLCFEEENWLDPVDI